ncbi:DNA repair protein [Idiomarina sp.]|uniref:DNA repair protein n=1 Tax=Idiomarina sp. TaxID=1874361 RepID=UPI0035137D1E
MGFIKRAGSKVWNSITGKKYAIQAEKLYRATKEKYETACEHYQKQVEQIGKSIEQRVNRINQYKLDIYEVHFERFKNIARRLKNVTIQGQPFEELFDDSILEIKQHVELREQNELMLIDFDNMSFLETAGMILTLGIFSRKKAKESLANVREEAARIDEEIEKMNTQLTQLGVVLKSIDAVAGYFDSLILNYEKLLQRFEWGVQSQRVYQMSEQNNLFSLRLDFRLLPTIHIEEFLALFNLSVVLKQMANLGYLSEQGDVLEADADRAEKLHKVLNDKFNLAS